MQGLLLFAALLRSKPRRSRAILYISVAFIVYLWGWFGLRQPGIFSSQAAAGERTAGKAATPRPGMPGAWNA